MKLKESAEAQIRNKIAPAIVALDKLAKKEKVSVQFLRIAVRDLKKAAEILAESKD